MEQKLEEINQNLNNKIEETKREISENQQEIGGACRRNKRKNG